MLSNFIHLIQIQIRTIGSLESLESESDYESECESDYDNNSYSENSKISVASYEMSIEDLTERFLLKYE